MYGFIHVGRRVDGRSQGGEQPLELLKGHHVDILGLDLLLATAV